MGEVNSGSKWASPERSEGRAQTHKPTVRNPIVREPINPIGLPPSPTGYRPPATNHNHYAVIQEPRNQMNSWRGEGEARAERGLSPSPALYVKPEPRSATEQVALRRGFRIVLYLLLLHSDEASKRPSVGVELCCGGAERRSGALLHSAEAPPIRIILCGFQWKWRLCSWKYIMRNIIGEPMRNWRCCYAKLTMRFARGDGGDFYFAKLSQSIATHTHTGLCCE